MKFGNYLCLGKFHEHFLYLAVLEQNFYTSLAHCVDVSIRPIFRTKGLIADVQDRMEHDPIKSLQCVSQEIEFLMDHVDAFKARLANKSPQASCVVSVVE